MTCVCGTNRLDLFDRVAHEGGYCGIYFGSSSVPSLFFKTGFDSQVILFELPQQRAFATKGGLALVPEVANIEETAGHSSYSESKLFRLL